MKRFIRRAVAAVLLSSGACVASRGAPKPLTRKTTRRATGTAVAAIPAAFEFPSGEFAGVGRRPAVYSATAAETAVETSVPARFAAFAAADTASAAAFLSSLNDFSRRIGVASRRRSPGRGVSSIANPRSHSGSTAARSGKYTSAMAAPSASVDVPSSPSPPFALASASRASSRAPMNASRFFFAFAVAAAIARSPSVARGSLRIRVISASLISPDARANGATFSFSVSIFRDSSASFRSFSPLASFSSNALDALSLFMMSA
mmetsp:Transcript_8470/g.30999  ORF Transcript_8470/g.30999 Transcript_8470/m.30999 type:complete len:262 (-) Transcript_8470:1018-1803(-)